MLNVGFVQAWVAFIRALVGFMQGLRWLHIEVRVAFMPVQLVLAFAVRTCRLYQRAFAGLDWVYVDVDS